MAQQLVAVQRVDVDNYLMIPPTSRLNRLASRPLAVKNAPLVGGGPISDVTPNAVNWQNIGYDGLSGMFIYSEAQITGINQTITLKLQYTGASIYVRKENYAGAIVFGHSESSEDPVLAGMFTVYNNGTFTVTNGQYVTFGSDEGISTFTVTVVNQSDGNAVLDTFTAGPIGGGGPS